MLENFIRFFMAGINITGVSYVYSQQIAVDYRESSGIVYSRPLLRGRE